MAHGFVLHKDPNTCASILGAASLRGSGAAIGQNYKEDDDLLYLALKEFHLIHPSFTKLEALEDVCVKENLEIANNDFGMGWKPELDSIDITQSLSSLRTVMNAAVKVQQTGVADSIESDLLNLSVLINASGLATRTTTTTTPTTASKLNVVNNAGTARSKDCTLIITEGDSRTGRCVLASAKACYKYTFMYGQVGSINQEVIKAYFTITSINWCWIFLDCIWVLFTSPLAKSMKNLLKLRPTALNPGPNTMWSTCGTHAISFAFLVIALATYLAQEWLQCRYWGSNDVSNPDFICNNCKTSVIFIVSGYQYISSAAAFNFGYSFRQNWFCSYVFVFLFLLFTVIQFGMTLYLLDLAMKLLSDFFMLVRLVS